MMIRVKVGRQAGEVIDVEPVSARAMLADGRAELAFADPAPAKPEVRIPPRAVMGTEFLPGAVRHQPKGKRAR